MQEKQTFLNHLRKDGDDPVKYFEDEELAEIAEAAGQIKDRLPKPLDLRSMAAVVDLDAYYTIFYYWPSLYTHPTAMGMSALTQLTNDGVSFKDGPKRQDADRALMGSHCCLLLALKVHIHYFGVAIDLAPRLENYKKYWPDRIEEGT